METYDILALRPEAATSAEIKASLQRIDTATASVETTRRDLPKLFRHK